MPTQATTSSETDEALIARVASRDQEALACLYDRYRSVIFSLALRVVRDRAEAEEILADVFMQAWKQASGFSRARGSVPAWLTTFCRSRAIDRLRARGRRETAMNVLARDEMDLGGAMGAETSGADELMEIKMKRRRILSALAQLAPRQRQAIELAYYGGLTHTEIAAKLEEPLGTVKTWIRQGLLSLKDGLAAQFGSRVDAGGIDDRGTV